MPKKAIQNPFTDVDFLRHYPGHSVADHEVFMAFNGDDQAIAFHEWWNESGAILFQEWLDRRETES